ncbi:MAG: adenine phosphoribosyltransferase [Campylobacterota bacterium]|nr:adenine phosphoribosyltransferase [Campylobacterota bacterium]
MLNSNDKELIVDSIRDIHDFPEPGIVFKDITTLLNDAAAYSALMNHLKNRYEDYNLDFIAGIDARGFIFGATLAQMLNVGFVPIRKKGKLPHQTASEAYDLEYGSDEVEIHVDAFRGVSNARVLLIDDLIATGGTAEAAVKLVNKSQGECVEACFILGLDFLDGQQKIEELTNIYTVIGID